MRRGLRQAAFTLAETIVAAGVCSIALAALTVGSIALQRGFSAAEYQMECQEDQLRVLDYIARDLRRASSATVSNQNRTLTLTLPGYKATPGSTGPGVPDVSSGMVTYAAAPITVSYYISGANFVRHEGATDTVLSTHLEQFLALDTNRPQFEFRLNFVPRFSQNGGVNGRAATQVTTTIAMRNQEGMLQ